MAGKQEAEVLFEYEKTQDDELSLKVGQIIHDVVQADEGWCEGTLNGVRGMFPDNFVKIRPVQTPAPAQPPPPAETKTPMRDAGGAIKNRRAKVAFSYAAENTDELSLEPGQVVEIIAEEEEGWFKGRLNGKVGVFPSNFLGEDVSVAEAAPVSQEPAPPKPEEPAAPKHPVMGQKLFPSINPALARAQLKSSNTHPPPEKKPAPPPPASNTHRPPPEKPAEKKPPVERAKVNFEYEADNADELTIQPGDVVEIVNKDTDQDGWWKVKLGDKVGLIPDNFVELLPPSSAPTHPPPPAAKAKAPPLPSDHKPPHKEAPSKPLPPRSGSVSRPAPPQPERPPPPAEPKAPLQPKEEPTEENADFGVPHTDPLDSSAVKNRPKKTSRPPSRSNLHMDEANNAEPPPEPKPEKPTTPSAGGLSPWQAELQKRKANKPAPPPTAKPARKPAVRPPAAEKPAVKPPPSKPHPNVKPHVEPTPQPPREQSPSPHPPSVSPTPTSTPAHAPPTPSHTAAAAAPPDDSWKESYEKLQDEFDKFKEYVKEQFAMLTNDLDDERKHWRGLEVDIDRLKKKTSSK